MSFLCELDRAHSRLNLMLEQSLKRWGITASQFRMLDILSSEEKFRPKDLAEILEIDVAASSRLIDRLEQKEMVERIRCTDDRRVCFISLSESFKNEFSKIKEHEQRVEHFFLEGISKKNREAFQEAVTELASLKKYRSGESGLSVVF